MLSLGLRVVCYLPQQASRSCFDGNHGHDKPAHHVSRSFGDWACFVQGITMPICALTSYPSHSPSLSCQSTLKGILGRRGIAPVTSLYVLPPAPTHLCTLPDMSPAIFGGEGRPGCSVLAQGGGAGGMSGLEGYDWREATVVCLICCLEIKIGKIQSKIGILEQRSRYFFWRRCLGEIMVEISFPASRVIVC
jgi:hypothetical protein